ncbi:MAG: hypothetical protein Q8M03_09135 [Legionella sp.]|nr:hypothetical protein [Legionella sp.]
MMEENIALHIRDLIINDDPNDLVQFLLTQKTKLCNSDSWDYRTENKIIETAARDAMLAGQTAIIKILFRAGLSPYSYQFADTREERCLVYHAVISRNPEMVKLWVEYSAHVYLPEGEPTFIPDYALAAAIEEGDFLTTRSLLEYGANANGVSSGKLLERSHREITHLVKAAALGHSSIVALLIEHGAEVSGALQNAYYNIRPLTNKNSFFKFQAFFTSELQMEETMSELSEKINAMKRVYDQIIRTCMEYASGCNLKLDTRLRALETPFHYFTDLDVSGMNFIAVAIDDMTVTSDALASHDIKGADKALITPLNLLALGDEERKQRLTQHLNGLLAKRGELVDQNGVINLLPLDIAAVKGDKVAVKVRLQAGEDPNLQQDSPLVLAVQEGHSDIAKMVYEAHVEHSENKVKHLITAARDFLAKNSPTQSFSVINGELKAVSLPFVSDHYQVILPGKDYVSRALGLIKSVSLDSIRNFFENNRYNNQNVVIIPGRGKSASMVMQYEQSAVSENLRPAFHEIIKLTTNDQYFPVIITNDTLKIIEILITSQYEKLDNFKSHTLRAIEIARAKNNSDMLEFLEERTDVNQTNKIGSSLLHMAASQNDLERVNSLIARGADVNCLDSYDSKPLNDAIEAGACEVAALLLPLTTKTPLVRKHYSLTREPTEESYSDPWYTDLLFTAFLKTQYRPKDYDYTPTAQVYAQGMQLLALLKTHGADFNVKSRFGDTLLNQVIIGLTSTDVVGFDDFDSEFEEQLNVLNFLLINDANPNIEGRSTWYRSVVASGLTYTTPLALFIEQKDLGYSEQSTESVINLLVKGGADVNAMSNGKTLLEVAADRNDWVAIKSLVKHGAVNIRSGVNTKVETVVKLGLFKSTYEPHHAILAQAVETWVKDQIRNEGPR